MKKLSIKAPENRQLVGDITLTGSKSIANRALIIRALTKGGFEIQNLSNADDSLTLKRLLESESQVLDAGAGGTTFRFLTAFFAVSEGKEIVLTGSQRMKERPIRLLVDALRTLGAEITYSESEGFPPLCIKGKRLKGGKVTIPASTSSQYISALLMIAPTLENGLELELQGEIVSLPYILMTLNLMKYFGAVASIQGNVINVQPVAYTSRPFFVEADWSAASYYYSLVFLSDFSQIVLNGLSEDSTQGDAVIAKIFGKWVKTTYSNHSVLLEKISNPLPEVFDYDFIECPDLAQTVIVALAAKKINAQFRGLKTLLIKETDRVAALDNELSKYGAHLKGQVNDNLWQLHSDEMQYHPLPLPEIQTYEDHRMAMSFVPLSLKTEELIVQEPQVVTKSYPEFWNHMSLLGFDVTEL